MKYGFRVMQNLKILKDLLDSFLLLESGVLHFAADELKMRLNWQIFKCSNYWRCL